jgi:hypothetical protein
MGAQNRSAGLRRTKRVENDEFIVAISSAAVGANFGNTAFACNPGQASTFPWLAGEATQWEKYRFEYLEFYYEHDVSSFATAGTTGKVIMSFDYDAADSPPTTKQQMLDTQPHADGMPNEDFGMSMDPPDLDGRTDLHYVRLASSGRCRHTSLRCRQPQCCHTGHSFQRNRTWGAPRAIRRGI